MDTVLNELGFVGNNKGMMIYDLRNTSQPTWDSRTYANKQDNSKDNDLSLHKQLTKIKCFPKGGGFVVGGIDGRCWIKSDPSYFNMVSG